MWSPRLSQTTWNALAPAVLVSCFFVAFWVVNDPLDVSRRILMLIALLGALAAISLILVISRRLFVRWCAIRGHNWRYFEPYSPEVTSRDRDWRRHYCRRCGESAEHRPKLDVYNGAICVDCLISL